MRTTFQKKAVFIIDREAYDDEENLMMLALEAGADDFKAQEDSFEITADPKDFDAIAKALEDNNIETVEAEVTMMPDTTVTLTGKDADTVMKLIDALEEHDDVQNVYANYDIDEEA